MKVKLTFLLSLICVGAFAQENHLSVDADFLTRGEIRSGKTGHVLSVKGNAFLMDGKPFNMWGIRVASATEDEQSLAHLTAQLDNYNSYGVNTLAVYLMGSSGGAYDPFDPSGAKMDNSHRRRMERLVREAGKRGMAVVIGIFYQRVPAERIHLQDWEASVNAVRTVAKWLKRRNFRNVILNIANEQNSSYYRDKPWARVNNTDDILYLCRTAKEVNPRLIVGAGGYDLEKNIVIGNSPDTDVLLFDTSKPEEPSIFHFGKYRESGIRKPMVNVEMFGAWTKKFADGVFIGNPDLKYYYEEVDSASSTEGLYTFFFAADWLQGKSYGKVNRYDLAGRGTPEDPGIRWYFEYLKSL